MPHIILRGQPDLRAAAQRFEATRADGNGWIVRLKEFYVDSKARHVLVDCTAVRSGFSQDFYIRAELKGDGTTVRVDPYMRIERNEGVQRAVLAVARFLLAAAPTLQFDKTNLPPEIAAELAPAAGES